MKTLVLFVRIIVGLLFIFSGLVKANDPLGLSYKMQEFFELWGMIKFYPATLSLSVLMNAFEIIAGVALLIGWRIRLFIWLLLLLIIFFTFLTGYAHFSGKFHNCGCFGDCIPISANMSFNKDVILLVLIIFLFWQQKKILPLFGKRTSVITMIVVSILSFFLQWYTLTYLPLVDCLPFKKGNNIPVQMKSPPGSRPDSMAIVFVYKKGGKEFEFSPADLPADLKTYKFVSRNDKLIRKGNAQPAISGFSLSGNTNIDSTQIVLEHPFTILLFCENFSTPLSSWEQEFGNIYKVAREKNIPVYLITIQPSKAAEIIRKTSFSDIPVFKCDETPVRTAARTNPCIYILERGTVRDKWSYKHMNKALKELGSIPPQQKTESGIPGADTTITP